MAVELKPGITKYQAHAFIDALCTWTSESPSGDPCGELRSPYAVACIEGALGKGAVPYEETIFNVFKGRRLRDEAEINVVRRFHDYLQDVTDHLGEALRVVTEKTITK